MSEGQVWLLGITFSVLTFDFRTRGYKFGPLRFKFGSLCLDFERPKILLMGVDLSPLGFNFRVVGVDFLPLCKSQYLSPGV